MTKHADASPSSASIWLKCPASVTLARGKKRLPSPYTREGTAAHEAAEHVDPRLASAGRGDGGRRGHRRLRRDAGARRDLHQVCRRALHKRSDWFAAETRIELLDLPEPLFGTSDAMGYDDLSTKTLEVVDLKYGKGVSVDVERQPATQDLRARRACVRSRTTLNASSSPSSSPGPPDRPSKASPCLASELWIWQAETLEPALQRIADNDPTETPGAHCRWCVRAGECKALASIGAD